MNRERITVFAVAALFYVAGGWSLFGAYEREVRSPERTGEWKSTEAMISAAYQQDAQDHDLTLNRNFLGYKYLADGVWYEVKNSSALVMRRRGHFRGRVVHLSVTE